MPWVEADAAHRCRQSPVSSRRPLRRVWSPWHERRDVSTVTGLRAEGRLGRIVLDWTPLPWDTVVDHYAVYGAPDASDVEPSRETLLAKTVYPHYLHSGLGGNARRWAYRVVTVDAAGARSKPSAPLATSSQASVTATSSPLAVVGSYDGRGLEFALSPNGDNRFPATFADGVDYRVGADVR